MLGRFEFIFPLEVRRNQLKYFDFLCGVGQREEENWSWLKDIAGI